MRMANPVQRHHIEHFGRAACSYVPDPTGGALNEDTLRNNTQCDPA